MDKLINIDQFLLSENGSSIQEVRFYKIVWIGYCHPVVVLVGLLGNLVVLLVLPQLTYAMSDKSRVQYICLAVFDLLTLLNFHFLQVFLGDSLYYATRGRYYFYLEKVTHISCKLCWFNWYLLMCLASYCDLEFCVERAICVLGSFTRSGFPSSSARRSSSRSSPST